MEKFTSLLIACSLGIAGAVLAQQPDEQSSPKESKQGTEKTEKVEPKVKTEAKTEAKTEVKPSRQHEAKTDVGASKTLKTEATPKAEKSAAGAETGVSAQSAATSTPKAPKHAHGATAVASPSAKPEASASISASTPAKSAKSAKTTATAAASATPSSTAMASATPAASATVSASPATSASPAVSASASASPSVAASASASATVAASAGQQNAALAAKKPDPQQVQQIKQQHANFRAQPRPDRVPTVTFNASYRIDGSDRWQGRQYEVFRSYRPERHDERWYRSHYPRVELIGGGYYYMNNGYWYPAWGYSSSHEYYAYDGPIYVGHRAEPPDRVIADVQAVLQNMGYYKGEVDGLLGPLTRQALTAYQADRGLATTAAIDEPTLDSLDMG